MFNPLFKIMDSNVNDNIEHSIVTITEEQNQKYLEENNHPLFDFDEQGDVFVCRICLDEENTPGNMIAPCRCSGTAKFIHTYCLDEWRRTSQNPNAATECLICHTPYNIVPTPKHFFHYWCIHINYNYVSIFVFQQILTIFLTMICLQNNMKFTSDYKNSSERRSNLNLYVNTYIFLSTIINLLLILYTVYVWVRYSIQKRKMCIKIFQRQISVLLCPTLFMIFIYTYIPNMTLYIFCTGTFILHFFITQTFEILEKNNRFHNQDMIVNYI